jgi:putative ABC transport system permease protein
MRGRATDPFALRCCLAVIRACAVLVPAGERAEWRQEWDAELRHRWGLLGRRRELTWRARMHLFRRALGALPDAAWLRRQFTSDAEAVHDAAHTFRMLWKAPGFTAVALLVFAAGIGSTTAIVSLVDALMLRPLPLPGAERIATLWQHNTTTGVDREDVAPGNAISWIEEARSFEAAAAIEPWSIDYLGGAEPEVVMAAKVSKGFFDVLGNPFLLGAGFPEDAHRRGNDNFAVLSHAEWQRRFGADPSIAGRTIVLDGRAHVVTGVLREGVELRMLDQRDERGVLLPKYYEDYERLTRGSNYWNVIARLREGVSVDAARAEMDTISARLAREYPRTNANVRAQVVPLRDHLAGSLRSALPLLVGCAVLVLIVACANVANLLLARGAVRGREFAVRQAVGAGRGRLFRQMLVESLVLAAAGGVAGLLLARWSLDLVARLRPSDVAGLDHVPLDARAAAIATGLTILAAIAAGLAPAWHLSRPASATALREGRTGFGPRGVLRGALVIVEVALAMLLVVGAGLLVRSFWLIQQVDPGFRREHVLALQVFAYDRQDTPEKRAVFFDQAIDRIRQLPGVSLAGAVSAMPFIEANINIQTVLAVHGRPPAGPGEDTTGFVTVVGGDYFRAMGIPLDRGRPFESSDTATSSRVALVSRAAATKLWPGADPIGSKVRLRFLGEIMDAEIVGVVGEVRHDALDEPARPELFLWHPQAPFGSMTFVVRAQPGAGLTMEAVKAAVRALDPQMAFYRTATIDELVSRTLVGRRFSLTLVVGFGLVALLLAAAGLYGVISFSTGQRTREFGVRLALGATPGDIHRLILSEGLRLAVVGVALGTAAALWATRILQSLVFGVSTSDPLTFASVGILVGAVALASSYIPARRAIRVDPVTALRAE